MQTQLNLEKILNLRKSLKNKKNTQLKKMHLSKIRRYRNRSICDKDYIKSFGDTLVANKFDMSKHEISRARKKSLIQTQTSKFWENTKLKAELSKRKQSDSDGSPVFKGFRYHKRSSTLKSNHTESTTPPDSKAGYITEYKMKNLMNDLKKNLTERYEKKITELKFSYETEISDLTKKLEHKTKENREIIEAADENSRKCGKIIDKLREQLNTQNKKYHSLNAKSENTSLGFTEEKKQTERLRETMGFFIKNSTIYSAKTKDYKMACLHLQDENKQLLEANYNLEQTLESLQKEKLQIEEKCSTVKNEAQKIKDCLKLLGLTLQDIKRNFNHGLVYLVKPKSPKRIVLITTDFQMKSEQREIMEMDEKQKIDYFQFLNGLLVKTVGCYNAEKPIMDLFKRNEQDVYNFTHYSEGDIVNGVWQGKE
ncbi:unnamed protein product [Moneuplotes crassus]|uniref:Uncharacterized protein n=1 Tax=Euplotes crassus TaxID=5936 RepID=A0AAD1UAY3_EUPCR|nr:unnamed protein product [Moneuplotes crassus]